LKERNGNAQNRQAFYTHEIGKTLNVVTLNIIPQQSDRYAARAAARAAAWDAAGAAERQWQLDMVIGLIEQDEEKAANDKG
jgi:hypothetical protein